MANVVIVVDMQNGFMRADGTLYCGDQAREIIPRVAARARGEQDAGAARSAELNAEEDAGTITCLARGYMLRPLHCYRWPERQQVRMQFLCEPAIGLLALGLRRRREGRRGW